MIGAIDVYYPDDGSVIAFIERSVFLYLFDEVLDMTFNSPTLNR